jgi:hypothetical protein
LLYVVPDTEEGWSAKKTFLGKAVYNESKQKVGTITDLLVAPDTSVAFVVIGAGGFVGLGRHNVAVRTGDLRVDNGLCCSARLESLGCPEARVSEKRPKLAQSRRSITRPSSDVGTQEGLINNGRECLWGIETRVISAAIGCGKP